MIYIANTPQASSQFNPNKEGSKEPFPYDISVSLPRRSSMFYGVKYANDMNENPRYTAEKPIEDINIPDFSQEQDGSGKAVKGEKHVSIVRPEDNNEIPSDHSDNVPQAQVVKKTVVRFRPSSSSSTAPPSENVKFMPLQKQPKPSTQGKYVHKIPMKHSKLSADLKTIDGRKFMPVKESEDKLRSSIAQAKLRESQDARTSVIGAPPMRHSSVARDDRFPQPEEETVIYPVHTVPVRKSVLRSSGVRRPSILERQSIVRRESVGKRKSRASWQQSVELQETDQDQNFPFRQEEAPMVYAVPIIPTRGRSKSVLQQSVKSLTSKNPTDSSGVHRKNIRYSMDTDVFAAEVRRRSVAQERPGYVNMEKGQTVLVSEVLNPITSLFITDLKDPVPKDPLTKPKEANVWVQPRPQRQSFQKKPVLKQSKPSPVHVVYQERPTKERTVQRRQSRSHQTYSRDDSSSSEDSLEMDRGKYKHGRRQYHQVYAAQMPEVMLPDITAGKGKNPSFQKKGKPIETDLQPSTSKDYCGLTMDAPVNSTAPMDTQVKMVSSEQQTDVEEETDLVCYPSEQFLKSAALSASEPGSKLRWRIIIKRGEEK
ncbi:uncharacterized protein LOC124364490 [Homalodisca vitripennis]|uniref:uncharacterized protein LOC124364490 n=1 Tax=Homalodisca vitripennis TaxID=197043 RepID=UPI001EEA5DCB|nr:uncharacterized protein LOC124364490 [Homalodisca vitripennis]